MYTILRRLVFLQNYSLMFLGVYARLLIKRLLLYIYKKPFKLNRIVNGTKKVEYCIQIAACIVIFRKYYFSYTVYNFNY